jgi:hypothetical protein
MAERKVTVQAELPESVFNALVELANKKGVSANTAIQQAIETEKYFFEKGQEGSQVIIQDRNKRYSKVIKKKKRALR